MREQVHWKSAKWLVFLLLLGCDRPQPEPNVGKVHHIEGRDEGSPPYNRELLYRMRSPAEWRFVAAGRESSLFDSRLPLAELVIDPELSLAIHNFPIVEGAASIPPEAQAARWKRQFDRLDEAASSLKPQSWGGFAGLLLEARGTIDGKERAMMAWAMQLAPEHRAALAEERGRSADYTLKAVGPPELMEEYREALIAAAHSFELIEEICSPL